MNRPRARRTRLLLLALGLAVVVAVATLATASLAGSPSPRPKRSVSRQKQELSYINAAGQTTDQSDPACAPPPLPPTSNPGSPHDALLSILGVLRRPAMPADAFPPNRPLFSNGLPRLGGVGIFVRYIRRALVAFGSAYYLWPSANARATPVVPPRCFAEQTAALHQELPRIPRALRAPTLKLAAALLSQEQRSQDAPPEEGIFLYAFDLNGLGGAGGGGASATEIQNGQMLQSNTSPQQVLLSGVVPDEVAKITLYYPSRSSTTAPPTAIVATPTNNVFVAAVPRTAPNGTPQKILWQNARGSIIKQITPDR